MTECPFGCKLDRVSLAHHIFYKHDEEDVAKKLAELITTIEQRIKELEAENGSLAAREELKALLGKEKE